MVRSDSSSTSDDSSDSNYVHSGHSNRRDSSHRSRRRPRHGERKHHSRRRAVDSSDSDSGSSTSDSDGDDGTGRRRHDVEEGHRGHRQHSRHKGEADSSDESSYDSDDDRKRLIGDRRHRGSKKHYLLYTLIGMVLLALIIGGGYYWYTHRSASATSGVSSATATGASQPSASKASGVRSTATSNSGSVSLSTSVLGGLNTFTDGIGSESISTTMHDSKTTGIAVGTKTSGGTANSSMGTASSTTGPKSATKTGTGASAASATSTSPSSNATAGAPYFVIYTDSGSAVPKAADLTGFNVLMLAFWVGGTSTTAAADMAADWVQSTTQVADKATYTKAGIKVMVSAFGSTIYPTTSNMDPKTTADDLAAFVKKNNLDGVDVDYEDSTAFDAGTAEAWLITFTTELRNKLPSPTYLISHAPQGPHFTSPTTYKGGGYPKVHKSVGSMIDFYNIQYYNQGASSYVTCTDLVTKCASFPGTSILELQAQGVPFNKIVLGKPALSSDGGSGYMAPSALKPCVASAKAKNWNGGLMWWEYHTGGAAKTLVSSSWG